MIAVGIDIGLSGAIAVVRGDQLLGVEDMPTREKPNSQALIKREVDPKALRAAILRLCDGNKDEAIACVIEMVMGMPNRDKFGNRTHAQGSASVMALGDTRGTIRSVVELLGLNAEWIAAQTWKRHFDLIGDTGRDKNAARRKALELYPSADLARVKDHNRAEAILIARFGYERFA